MIVDRIDVGVVDIGGLGAIDLLSAGGYADWRIFIPLLLSANDRRAIPQLDYSRPRADCPFGSDCGYSDRVRLGLSMTWQERLIVSLAQYSDSAALRVR